MENVWAGSFPSLHRLSEPEQFQGGGETGHRPPLVGMESRQRLCQQYADLSKSSKMNGHVIQLSYHVVPQGQEMESIC